MAYYRQSNFESLSDSESETEFGIKQSKISDILCEVERNGSPKRGSSSTQIAKGKCNWCFSARTAIIGTLLVIILTALIILVIDLTIFEVERSERRAYFARMRGENYDTGPVTRYTYSLNGSEDAESMEIFKQVPNKWNLEHIYLSNVEVAPAVLLRQLEYADNLETISLINVTVFGRLGAQPNVYLPSLKSYTLVLNQPIGPKELLRLQNRNCSVTDIQSAITFSSFQDKNCLRSLIIFDKYHMDRDWTIEQVHMLDTTIRVTLFGFHLFTLDTEAGELTSVLDYSQDILEHILNENSETHGAVSEKPITFTLTKLNLRACPMKLETLGKFSDQLTSLHLGSLNFTEKDPNLLSSTIGKFKKLNRFYFMGFGHFPTELQFIDINDITSNVTELRLGLVDMDYRNMHNGTMVPRLNLDHFYLHHIGVKNVEIINRFHEIVTAKRIYWDGKNYGKVPFSRFQLWVNIMKMPNVEFILFDDSRSYHFPGRTSPAAPQLQSIAMNTTVRTLLQNINVNINLNQPFVLRRDNTTNGQWKGRNFDINDDKDTLQLYMEGGNVDEKFLNIETFVKLRFPDLDGQIEL